MPVTKNVGYTNTPLIPGTSWHVHDGDRPQPRVVTPAAAFSHLAPAPSDAVILFDGSGLAKWTGPGGQAKWKVENGYMEVAPKSGSIRTRDTFADFQLHLEFATPAATQLRVTMALRSLVTPGTPVRCVSGTADVVAAKGGGLELP